MKYFFVFLLLISHVAYADQVYKQLDKNGNIIYSDQPLDKNATTVGNLNANIAPSSNANTDNADTTQQANVATTSITDQPYTRFAIQSPADEESIQNQPTITVKFDVVPALKKGDKIQAYLDGNPWDQAFPSNTLTFTIPDRGTHYIYAELLDKDSRPIMKTKSITIYVHQASIGNQKRLNSLSINQTSDRG